MKILAHRGFWKTEKEKNSLIAFKRAFEYGFGIETDLRDMNGDIVISHNPAILMMPTFADLIELYNNAGLDMTMALNIKADGLYLILNEKAEVYNLENINYFFFDMSVPELYAYRNEGYRVYTRSSEFETEPVMIDRCAGVWLDQFENNDHIMKNLSRMVGLGKEITIVSPELHGRNYIELWNELREYSDNDNVCICTDKPDEAKVFFGGNI